MIKTSGIIFILIFFSIHIVFASCTGGRNFLDVGVSRGGGGGDDLAALLILSTTSTFLLMTTEITCNMAAEDTNQKSASRSGSGVNSETTKDTNNNETKHKETYLKEKILPHFTENQEKIKEEAARGSGENLETLASLYGCQETVYKNFMKMMRSSYLMIFQDQLTEEEQVNKIQLYIEFDDVLTNNCKF